MIKPKSPKDGQWQKMRGASYNVTQRPPSTSSWSSTRKAGLASGQCENQTIQNPKPNSAVSLSQASTSAAGSSSSKQSRTPQQQNSEGRNCHHQDYHQAPDFSVRPPMSGPWGPAPMMFPPCPPWMGWYGPWVPPPMHFHVGWSGPPQGFGHGGYYTGDGCYRHIGHLHGREASG
jgi:hypothetical protein